MSPEMTPMKILVPIDFSPTSLNGLEHAVALAGRLGAHLILIHVVEYNPTLHSMEVGTDWYRPETRQELGRRLEALVEARVGAGIPTTTEVLVDHDAGSSIVAAAERVNANLVVMGTHGRRGIPRFFLGSVARRVSQDCRCPVLTTRAGLSEDKAACA